MGDLSKHFDRTEFACQCGEGCGFDTVDAELLQRLEDLRAAFGRPVIVSSGCRCRHHNDAIGGASQSQHLTGKAADIYIHNRRPEEIRDWFDARFPTRYGLGCYTSWVHIDVRREKARWGI